MNVTKVPTFGKYSSSDVELYVLNIFSEVHQFHLVSIKTTEQT